MAVGGEVSFLLVQAELASLHQSHGRKSLPWLWLHYASRLNSVVSPLMTKHAAISLVIVAALSSCAIMGQSQARNDGFLVHDAALADPDYLSGLDARPENEAVSTKRSPKSASVTLPTQATASPPSALIAATTSAAGSSSRSFTTMRAPSRASLSASARPMPRPDPEIRATLDRKSTRLNSSH